VSLLRDIKAPQYASLRLATPQHASERLGVPQFAVSGGASELSVPWPWPWYASRCASVCFDGSRWASVGLGLPMTRYPIPLA